MDFCECGNVKYAKYPGCCMTCYKSKGKRHSPMCLKDKYIIDENASYYFEVSRTGLGDRLGQIITVCTFSKCFELNNNIVLIWSNSEHRNYDLDTLKKYVTFPSNCIITEDIAFMENRIPLNSLSDLKNWDHSHDLIPEPSYKLLLESFILKKRISFHNYLDMYMTVANEITISDSILMGNTLPVNEYKCVHVRRDDKLFSIYQPFIPDHLIQQINNNENTQYLFISDDVIPSSITHKKNCSVFTLPNLTNVENVILDLFVLVNSNEVISVIYSDGWSSFSYVSSRTKNINLVSYVPPNSRYQNVCKRVGLNKLYNWDVIYIQ